MTSMHLSNNCVLNVMLANESSSVESTVLDCPRELITMEAS